MLARFEADAPAPSGSDTIKWFPRITVERYSPDQTAYAEGKFAELQAERRRPWVARFGLDRLLRKAAVSLGTIDGDWLRELFPGGPEDGYGYDSGNILVTTGLNSLTYLLTTGATTPQGTAGHNLLGTGGAGQGASIIGVGTSTTTAVQGDTALGTDNSVNAWYQQMDATFPSTTANGTLNGQVTVASGNGNFQWNEWCWATGSGTVTAGSHLTAVVGASALFNHKANVSLGSKASGASWVFTQTITFS